MATGISTTATSSLGISGLPLNDLLTNLRNNENQALALIQNQQAAASTKLSAYGKLKDAIGTLQSAASALNNDALYGTMSARSSSPAITALATGGAVAASYSIQVQQLASAQTLAAQGRASRTEAIGSGGELSFTFGDGSTRTLTLGAADTSLDALVSAVNADPDLGLSATLINDGSSAPYRMLLTSRTTGTQAAVTAIQVTGNTELQGFLGYDATGNPGNFIEQAAADARLDLGGIHVTSQTNTLTGVADGLTLTLNQTTTDPVTVSLAPDNGGATKAVQAFVTAYNSLGDTIGTLTSYNAASQSASALTGDTVTRSAQSRIRAALSNALGANGQTLSAAGITTDPKTGKLLLDTGKLGTALNDNLAGIKTLFSGTTGVGAQVSMTAETFTRSGGILATATTGLNDTIASLGKRYDATSALIDQRMATYQTQFTQLDALMTQMNSLSSYLTQQLSTLNTNRSSH